MNDTIAAISTPVGIGAISMVRMSGPDSWRIAKKLTRLERIEPRRVYKAVLRDDKGPLDDVMIVFYKSPKSYTGEDMVEITCHGGYTVTRMVLNAILKEGARIAEPGEFTKLAFLNGKIDLTEAEAVNDLILAKSELEVRNFFRNLKGELRSFVEGIRKKIVDLLARIQVELDYPEEIDIPPEDVIPDLKGIEGDLENVLEESDKVIGMIHGIRVAIVGKPNVGKSTILNLLLREDRAIVTPVPGTTRDVITGDINIRGYHFRLSDTAGLRRSDDPVERIGIDRAKEEIEKADLVLVVLDASNIDEEDERIIEIVNGKKKIVVVNKMDLVEKFEPPRWMDNYIEMVAIEGKGLEKLEEALVDAVKEDFEMLENKVLITNERQKILLQNALSSVKSALEALESGFPTDLAGMELERALSYLDELTGRSFREDLIETIFSNFCVGK